MIFAGFIWQCMQQGLLPYIQWLHSWQGKSVNSLTDWHLIGLNKGNIWYCINYLLYSKCPGYSNIVLYSGKHVFNFYNYWLLWNCPCFKFVFIKGSCSNAQYNTFFQFSRDAKVKTEIEKATKVLLGR